MKNITTTLLALSAAGPMSAAIIYVDFGSDVLPADSDIYINVLTQQVTSTLSYEDFNQGPWLSFFHGGSVIASSEQISPWTNQAVDYDGATAGHFFSNVPAGSTVSSAGVNTPLDGFIVGSYVTGESASDLHVGAGAGQFESGSAGYLVFSYEPVVGSGSFAYGWIRFTPQSSGSGFVIDAAFSDTVGAAILVGAIPEPSAATVLAGAVGLGAVALRRRRRGA
ncbi:MAG: hypothetical protein H7067_05445 [Burkholderiales bacterium]|nr:hypothetical protein [Opitutaceae bacterium]